MTDRLDPMHLCRDGAQPGLAAGCARCNPAPAVLARKVRFATPELETKDRVWQEERRAEKRRHRILKAVQTFTWHGCWHERRGPDCLVCILDFFLAPNASARIAEVDAALEEEARAAASIYRPQIGQWWRLPIGPALATCVEALLTEPRDLHTPARELPTPVPEPPELDVMCVGARGAASEPTAALMVPFDTTLLRSKPHPWIEVPLDYLLTHGVRHS